MLSFFNVLLELGYLNSNGVNTVTALTSKLFYSCLSQNFYSFFQPSFDLFLKKTMVSQPVRIFHCFVVTSVPLFTPFQPSPFKSDLKLLFCHAFFQPLLFPCFQQPPVLLLPALLHFFP